MPTSKPIVSSHLFFIHVTVSLITSRLLERLDRMCGKDKEYSPHRTKRYGCVDN